MKSKGFTLIELLVVIAIIGILASVVLASLNSARAKGADAAIKSNVTNARAQAELFYDNNSMTYTTVCSSGTNNIAQFITGATNAGSATVNCADSDTAWALQASLKSTPTSFYCVDSTGAATTTAASSIADGSDYICG
ncbi:MAG: prepilin-type N-terminal cleavage/methylation domain-containing protein [Candidatus Yonathbacteria bacterium]|nr:prepilin-type N-terminal cleavage/methylation domain-containing protein [Candidatus Yonathbacteria bacterium]